MALVGKTNEEKIWNFFKSKGLTEYGIAGLMGNLRAESGLNPINMENSYEKKLNHTDTTYTQSVDNGSYTNFVKDSVGYGLAQWTYWSRKQNLLNYVHERNTSIGDLESQLEFLYWELSSGYKSVLNVLKTAKTILAASNTVLTQFEKPKNQSTSVKNKRAEYGQEYYNKYASSETDAVRMDATEKQLRERVVSTAAKYIGSKENSENHKKIIDIYNSQCPLPRGYNVKYTDAWCATFVTFIGIETGLSEIILGECSCNKMIEKYQKIGRWIENDSYIPKIGDIIMYDWNDTGSGDCQGQADHVGIVRAISGNTMEIIEGNMNNSVGVRSLKVDGKYIRGYCIPNYADKSIKQPEVVQTADKVDYAKSFSKSIEGTYKTTANLYLRYGAGKNKKAITIMPKGHQVSCYGYYTVVSGVKWYLVKSDEKTGFCSSEYLQKM